MIFTLNFIHRMHQTFFIQQNIFVFTMNRDVYWGVLEQFYADKNHTNISGEYVIKIRCLKAPLSHAQTRDIPRIEKISDARTIKNRWLRTKAETVLRRQNHTKISREYSAKNRWPVSYAYKK